MQADRFETLDRLTHRCHLLQFRGDSYRFRESLAARSSTDETAHPRPRRTALPPEAPTEEETPPEA